MATPEAQSQEVATREHVKELVTTIRGEGFQSQIELALPEGMPASRFVRVAVTALVANPDLANAHPDSIFNSLLKAAADGLLPDGREAALVVYNVKGVPTAQYLPMIGGYRKIAAEHGWTLRTAVVHEHDEFEYELGAEPHLTHRPPRPGVDRGKMVAAYAVGRHRDYPTEFAVMYEEEIEKAKAVSRASGKGPWVDWPERMWEKTVGKYLFKRLALGERDERVSRLLAASDTPPVEAATLVYGGGPQRAIEASAPQAEEPVQQPAQQGTAGEEAAPDGAPAGHAGDPPAEAGVASPAESFEGEEPPAADQEPESQFAPPDIARAAAEGGLVSFTSGRYANLTIAQVHEEHTKPDKNGNPEGEAYLRWAVRSWKSEPQKSAVAAYARQHFPDALAEGQPA